MRFSLVDYVPTIGAPIASLLRLAAAAIKVINDELNPVERIDKTYNTIRLLRFIR